VGQNSGSIFAVCGQKYIELSLPVRDVRTLQCRFPIDDILLRSGDIRDQVDREVVRNRAEI